MKKLMKQLQLFAPKECKRYVEISLPIVTHLNGGLLRLRIKTTDEGFAIYCPDNLFYDANGNQRFYFSIFKAYSQSDCFGIHVRRERFYKEYGQEDSVVVVIDQFVRFVLQLENFILENDVIGHEENFPL